VEYCRVRVSTHWACALWGHGHCAGLRTVLVICGNPPPWLDSAAGLAPGMQSEAADTLGDVSPAGVVRCPLGGTGIIRGSIVEITGE
jgi:hypothetical protein